MTSILYIQLVTIYTMKFIKFKTNLRDKQTYTKVVNDFKKLFLQVYTARTHHVH